MGFVVSTYGIGRLINTAVPDTAYTGLRAAVLSTAGTITDAQIEDAQTNTGANGIIGVASEAEVTNANYARQTLTGVTLTRNTTANRLEITATAPVINNVAAGSVWKRILYYFEVGAAGSAGDATHIPLGVDTPAATLTPNGGNITLPALTIYINDTSV